MLRILLGGLGGNFGGRSLEPTLEASEGARRVLLIDKEDCRGAKEGRFCGERAESLALGPAAESC